MKDNIKKWSLWFFNSFIWLGVLMLVIDIVTKAVVVANMNVGDTIPLIPNFLHITYTVNTNAAFGIGFGSPLANRIVYIVIASLATIAIIYVYVKKFKVLNKFYRAMMMLILVGAVGNLIDRVFCTPEYLKYHLVGVIDWIDFRGIWSYIFNWADSCIVVGVITLAVYLIVQEIIEYRKNNSKVKLANEAMKKAEEVKVEEKEEKPEENKKND